MNRQLGLSLVETMIAIAISILLMAGAISVVASIKNTNKVNDALSSSQEIGRFALNVLTDAISRSGYYGCLQPITYTPQEEASLSASELQGRFYINPVAAFSSDNLSKTSLRGFGVSSANVWTPDPINAPYHQDVQKLKSAAFPPKKDSDVISVQHASTESADLTQDMVSKTDDIIISAGLSGIRQSSFLVIGDCNQADLFKVTNSPSTIAPIILKHEAVGVDTNVQPELRNLYTKATAQVYFFHNDTYYIADTGRKDSLGQSIEALMRLDVDGEVEELAEGIESLKIAYSQLNTNGTLQYLPASAAVDMRKVSQIKITLNTKVLKLATQKQNAINLNDGPYMRKTFSRTIEMRNRS